MQEVYTPILGFPAIVPEWPDDLAFDGKTPPDF